MSVQHGAGGTSAAREDADPARGTAAATRLECKVCWYVYDPAVGDPVWQIPPNTPWRELPAHWTCPACATTQDGFLVLSDD